MSVFTRTNLSRFSLSELKTISKLFHNPTLYQTKINAINSIISDSKKFEISQKIMDGKVGERIPICIGAEGNKLYFRYVVIDQ